MKYIKEYRKGSIFIDKSLIRLIKIWIKIEKKLVFASVSFKNALNLKSIIWNTSNYQIFNNSQEKSIYHKVIDNNKYGPVTNNQIISWGMQCLLQLGIDYKLGRKWLDNFKERWHLSHQV